MGGASTENRVIGWKAKGKMDAWGSLEGENERDNVKREEWKREKYKDSIDTSYLSPLEHMGETLIRILLL